MTEPEQPNYHVPETAQFRLEDLKAAMRGQWTITDTLDPDTIARLQAVRDTEPTLSVDHISINGHEHPLNTGNNTTSN